MPSEVNITQITPDMPFGLALPTTGASQGLLEVINTQPTPSPNTASMLSSAVKPVLIQFASIYPNQATGRLKLRHSLLGNIDGFPVELQQIGTIRALDSIQRIYFKMTYDALGLDPGAIVCWIVMLPQKNAEPIFSTPISTDSKWTQAIQSLSRTMSDQRVCIHVQPCFSCEQPPFILACFDEAALFNSLVSWSAPTTTKIDFLDTPLVNKAFARNIQASHGRLQDAYVKIVGQALTADGNDKQRLTYYLLEGSYFNNNLNTAGKGVGFCNADGTCVASSRDADTTRNLLPFHQPNNNSLTLVDAALPEQPHNYVSAPVGISTGHKRLISSPAGGDVKRKHSLKPLDPKPLPQERLTDDAPQWQQASPKPTENTKQVADRCLTCIWYNKKCNGTQLDGKGRCPGCSKRGKSNGRKCYWKDESRGILTYNQARAADDTSYPLPKNTRAGRAKRQDDYDAGGRRQSTKCALTAIAIDEDYEDDVVSTAESFHTSGTHRARVTDSPADNDDRNGALDFMPQASAYGPRSLVYNDVHANLATDKSSQFGSRPHQPVLQDTNLNIDPDLLNETPYSEQGWKEALSNGYDVGDQENHYAS